MSGEIYYNYIVLQPYHDENNHSYLLYGTAANGSNRLIIKRALSLGSAPFATLSAFQVDKHNVEITIEFGNALSIPMV